MGLSALGQSIIKGVAVKKFKIDNNLNLLIKQFDNSCPNQAELLKIIQQRNKLMNILNQLKRNVLKLDKTTKPFPKLLASLAKAEKALKSNNVPVATGAAGSPVVAFPLGSVLTAGASLALLNQKKLGLVSMVLAFGGIKKYILKTINDLIAKVKILDAKIEHCSQQSTTESTSTNNTQSTNQNINNQNQSIKDNLTINNELNLEDSDLINNLQNSESNDTNSYNGFKFEIELDTTSSNRFPKRYAIAKNASGITVLRGEPSFSSNVEVLIDELKFIIDRDNLKAN